MQESTSSKPVVNSSSMSFCPSAAKAKRNFKATKSQPGVRWPGINFRDLRNAEKVLKIRGSELQDTHWNTQKF